MSAAPTGGTVAGRRSRRPRRSHHKRTRRTEAQESLETGEKRPKVNPIFLWASQQEQRIVEVRCEDYDKRNRIKLTKTPQGWRSIPRTTIIPTLPVTNPDKDHQGYQNGVSPSDDDDDDEGARENKRHRHRRHRRRNHRRKLLEVEKIDEPRKEERRKTVSGTVTVPRLMLQPRVILEQLKPAQYPALRNGKVDSVRKDMPQGILTIIDETASSPEMGAMAADTPIADLPDSPVSPSAVPVTGGDSPDDEDYALTKIRGDSESKSDETRQEVGWDRSKSSPRNESAKGPTTITTENEPPETTLSLETRTESPERSEEACSVDGFQQRHLDDPILNALRNTPGLTVSVATGPRSPAVTPKRPPPGLLISVPGNSTASRRRNSSRSPSSQRGSIDTSLPREGSSNPTQPTNRGPGPASAIMSGLSISIPGYRYRPRATPDSGVTTTEPRKRGDHQDSPESTSHHHRPQSRYTCKLDESTVEEDSASQGTTTTTSGSVHQVSPQPSGIPCSPASGRPSSASGRSSSAYLELLLPSPPCSVSCSEDAKNDLTLKGILSSPNRHHARLNSEAVATTDSDEATGCQQDFSQFSACPGATRGNKRSGDTFTRLPSNDPASELRDLLRSSGHLIPDPLLVPRDQLPALAAAPYTEIPKLLATRPELRLPQALSRLDLLRDPDLLVISLAHLQHVLDHGEGPVVPEVERDRSKPKLSCKPIGTLMPGPIDLSSTRDRDRSNGTSSQPFLRVRTTGLLKQESEVTSTAVSPEESHFWHPLFGSQNRHHLLQLRDQQVQQQHNLHYYEDNNGHYQQIQRGFRLQQAPQRYHPFRQEQQVYHHRRTQQQQQSEQQKQQCNHAPWHRTTITS